MKDASELEDAIRSVGHEIAAALPAPTRHPLRRLDERAMARAGDEGELRAALFRFVDVAPACRSASDLARHLTDHLRQVDERTWPVRVALRAGRYALLRPLLGWAAAAGVRHMARRFIVERSTTDALGLLGRLYRRGVASTLDLLGEATLTRAEADSYATRCAAALEALTAGSRRWPERPQLEVDSLGPLPRANLSLKLTGLTPLLPPHAPEVGKQEARPRLRRLLGLARELEAHLHVDMEWFDTRETTLGLLLELLEEDEFRDGPSVGIVLQAYLLDSDQELEHVLAWSRSHLRRQPLVVRLVKGAYWDYEVATSRQRSWVPPVYTSKAECDANFERLTRLLLEARPAVRVAVGSHNLRSIAHAVAFSRALGADDRDLELQVLRGLGDDLQHALAKLGFRVRVYCPIGDRVEGMAYLVRRLLEDTSNEAFVHRQAAGEPR